MKTNAPGTPETSGIELEFFASCLGGLERVLADELKALGIERVRPLGGGVAFFCDIERAYRACLWSRLASRVMLVLGRVPASDADALYAGALEIAWEDIIASGASFTVRASGTNEALRNTRFTALKVKDAIADRLRERAQERRRSVSDTPESMGAPRSSGSSGTPSSSGSSGPSGASRAAIDVRLRDNRATLSFDFSGEALNHRTYLGEEDGDDAALACSKAAGMLALAGWRTLAEEADADASDPRFHAFVDPACRDGILLVEAASIACDKACGLDRGKWGFRSWAHHDEVLWNALVNEARDRFDAGLARVAGVDAAQARSSSAPNLRKVRFAGASDSSPAISRARAHVRRAGLRQAASVEIADASSVADLVSRVSAVASGKRGTVLNFPPGERGRSPISHQSRSGASAAAADACLPLLVASDIDSASRADSPAHSQAIETAFVVACAAAPSGSRFVVADGGDVRVRFGGQADATFKIGRGRIEVPVELFDSAPTGCARIEVADLAGGAPHVIEVLEPASDQFAARLRKVFKERRKWASREGVTCYRIYDADLPDYAVAIDWYTGAGDARGNNYLHISEYAAPASVDADRARRRFNDVLAIAPIVCGVRPDHVFSKRRVRAKGGGQYRNAGSRSYPTTVEEFGYLLEVDLSGRLDTGLFLDHRITRELIGRAAAGRSFLNLFAYTGTASVHAAGGGATTTTVDLSQTYLDWAQRNMAANGFTGSDHTFERADVIRWITDARRARKTFDLVFVDPPTFSNSKAMGRKTWDVQRDHVELLIGVAHLLAEGGEAIFSCNLRSFKPDTAKLERYGVHLEDISLDTIPLDFARTPKVHKCYRVTRIPKR